MIASGEMIVGSRKLATGKHTLSLRLTGANPSAVQAFMVGLDYLRIAPQ